MQNTFKRGRGDRYDGWRVRNVDPFFAVVPFVLRSRLDCQVLFEEKVPLEKAEAFIREHQSDMPGLSLMHVFIAAMVRLFSQKPYINRFIVYNKIYAHNSLTFSLAVKRSMDVHGEETTIQPEFEPTDTIYDVVRRVQEELATQDVGAENDTDAVAKIFRKLPTWLVRFVVGILRKLDNIGKMPKFINKVSPFHCSMFITNVGSLGIGPVYHHLYEFGTCSLFGAIGNKTRVNTVNKNGETVQERYLGLKFVVDERICDGYYFATAMKMLRRIFANPDVLLTPPEQVFVDDGVDRPRLDQ
ncbi:MAG: hypothetical protein IJP37_04470 [Clostridia bacterium]|nr:hypothetical protein [Clostridia bacterium]